MEFKLVNEDFRGYAANIGCGNIRRLYVAEVPGGKIYKSEFQKVEHEDIVILHFESMIFVPNEEIKIVNISKVP